MPLYPTVNATRPAVSVYGNTFAHNYGVDINEAETRGEIQPSSLNQTEMVGGVEFNGFEKQVYDWILARLGHPTVRVELTPFQIKGCIEEAFAIMEMHAPLWANQFATFKTTAGQGMYEIPPYILHNLSYVVYKKTVLSIQSLAGTLEQDFFIRYFQENFVFSDFQVGDFYLLQSHLEMIRKTLGNEGSWDIINGQYLQLYPVPVLNGEVVILQYKALDTDHMHPAYRNLIQRYALALAKGILSQVRGKFETLPGPGGGAKLNGPQLADQSERELEQIRAQIIDEFEEPPTVTLY